MPRVSWQLCGGRPVVEVELVAPDGTRVRRVLLADTGGGSALAGFEVVLSETDCQRHQHRVVGTAQMGGAIAGSFSRYIMRLEIPAIQVSRFVVAVGVPNLTVAPSIDGIAGFRFLNSFHYGNFADPTQFGLETI